MYVRLLPVQNSPVALSQSKNNILQGLIESNLPSPTATRVVFKLSFSSSLTLLQPHLPLSCFFFSSSEHKTAFHLSKSEVTVYSLV